MWHPNSSHAVLRSSEVSAGKNTDVKNIDDKRTVEGDEKSLNVALWSKTTGTRSQTIVQCSLLLSEEGIEHHEKSVFLFVRRHPRAVDAVVHKEFEVVRGKANRNLEQGIHW